MHDFILRHLHDKKIKKFGNYFVVSIKVDDNYDYIDFFKFIQLNVFFFKSSNLIEIMCICKTLFEYLIIKSVFINCVNYTTNDPISFCLLEAIMNEINWNIFLTQTGDIHQNVTFFNYLEICKNIK